MLTKLLLFLEDADECEVELFDKSPSCAEAVIVHLFKRLDTGDSVGKIPIFFKKSPPADNINGYISLNPIDA